MTLLEQLKKVNGEGYLFFPPMKIAVSDVDAMAADILGHMVEKYKDASAGKQVLALQTAMFWLVMILDSEEMNEDEMIATLTKMATD